MAACEQQVAFHTIGYLKRASFAEEPYAFRINSMLKTHDKSKNVSKEKKRPSTCILRKWAYKECTRTGYSFIEYNRFQILYRVFDDIERIWPDFSGVEQIFRMPKLFCSFLKNDFVWNESCWLFTWLGHPTDFYYCAWWILVNDHFRRRTTCSLLERSTLSVSTASLVHFHTNSC